MPELDDQVMDEMLENGEDEAQSEEGGKKFSFVKLGMPVLLVQIILAYFLASNFIVPRLYGDAATPQGKEVASGSDSTHVGDSTNTEKEESEEDAREFGQIFSVDDVIVNPAGSNGMQFVLINFGFEVRTEDDVKLLETRQIQVRDLLLRILSKRTMEQLDGPDDKESLRAEVKEELGKLLPENHLMAVYFSNYIIQ
ncbi:MAG: hypothetical protein Kow0037_19850 [Calditrichia bacterium]